MIKARAQTQLSYVQFAGEEPCYAGVPMSTIVEQGFGVGDVISLLWFKRSLPRYCTQFIEVRLSWGVCFARLSLFCIADQLFLFQ